MKNINFVVTSDPQYPWTDKTDAQLYEDDSVAKKRSEALIIEQYNNINNYASRSNKNLVVLVNGDLTAFGHGYQRSKMSQLLNILKPPVRWGLGNHDIQNNYHDSANNGAATDMMRMFINHYNSLTLTKKSWDVSVSKNTFRGSFNYSWDDGDFHFIQMHNFPGMTDYEFNKSRLSFSKTKIFMTWDKELFWLKKDIVNAISMKKHIIINVHQPDGWPPEAHNDMKTVFYKYKDNIKAIFSGHYHQHYGYQQKYTNYMGGNIPVFLSGSASQRTYLICESDEEKLSVYLVTNNNWEKRKLESVINLT